MEVIYTGLHRSPEEDRLKLLQLGVSEIFTPGGATQRTIEFLRKHFQSKGN